MFSMLGQHLTGNTPPHQNLIPLLIFQRVKMNQVSDYEVENKSCLNLYLNYFFFADQQAILNVGKKQTGKKYENPVFFLFSVSILVRN